MRTVCTFEETVIVASNVNNKRRWLITGGCGFIGTSLIKQILKERPGDRVRVLDNLSVGLRED
ncbi:MAG: hypothetical protein K9L30_18745, partial [Desulfobacterales bacterium]|nr:hypothetical protein [Desulfobacterales bacterium]